MLLRSGSISKSAAFVDNRSQSNGGAIYNAYGAELVLPDATTFEGNTIYDVGCHHREVIDLVVLNRFSSKRLYSRSHSDAAKVPRMPEKVGLDLKKSRCAKCFSLSKRGRLRRKLQTLACSKAGVRLSKTR